MTTRPARSIGRQHLRQRRDIAARENVFRDPGIGDARAVRCGRSSAAAHTPSSVEQLRAPAEEARRRGRRRHARTCRPKRCGRTCRRRRDSPASRKSRLLGRAALGGALRARRELLLRQRDAGDVGAGDLGEIKRQAAPAAADVEHRLRRARAEAWPRDGVSWRAARRRATGRASRNRRSYIAGRHRGRASRAGRRGRNGARHCAASADARIELLEAAEQIAHEPLRRRPIRRPRSVSAPA